MTPSASVWIVRFVAASAAVLALAAAAGAANPAPADRQLAKALLVGKNDGLPRSWVSHTRDPRHERERCLTRARGTVMARARALFGGPNSGMWSVATVLKTRTEANRYYGGLVLAIPRCLRQAARHEPIDADSIGVARCISFRRYGDRSAAWRIPAACAGNPRGSFHYDWVVVRTGRAVLVDLFALGADPGKVAFEQAVVRRAVKRAVGR
jgi:hypothetical protein